MSFMTNLMVDLLATSTPRGDLINFLPASLRAKARANLNARTLPVMTTTRGNMIYQTFSAREWKQRNNA